MTDVHKSAGPPKRNHKRDVPNLPPQAARPDRFAFTIDAKTGEIIQVESIDATGTRHELSKVDKAVLAQENGRARLEEYLEQAFEAGIACLLGDEDELEEGKEAKEEVELRHILLKSLIDESPAARLMRRDVLDRAIVDTLIHNSLKPREAPPKERDSSHAVPKTS